MENNSTANSESNIKSEEVGLEEESMVNETKLNKDSLLGMTPKIQRHHEPHHTLYTGPWQWLGDKYTFGLW